MKEKIRYFLSPSFLEKESLFKALKRMLETNKISLINKKVLDIGCGSKPYANLFEKRGANYEGIDFKKHSVNNTFNKARPDYYFQKEYSSTLKMSNLKDNSFDLIVSFQVLEHHRKPEIFFSEANRILKDRGSMLITFPFIWCLHEEPFDYQRLTHYKIADLASENNFKIVKIIKRGGVFSSVSQILNTSLFNSRLNKLLKWLIYILFLLPFQYMVYLIEKLSLKNNDRTAFLGYLILLKKESQK